MKLIVEIDEKFPVYSLRQPYEWSEESLDFPDGFYSEYLDIQYKYHKMQKELQDFYEQANAP